MPLSHDEVVHGKSSIIGRMPGDEWQKFANLRLLYSYMFTHPGTKLLFMGGEYGQHEEWNFEQSLSWHVLQYEVHKGAQRLVKDLNTLYKSTPALYEKQFVNEGFEWISYDDHENSIIAYIRKGNANEKVVVVCNMTPMPRAQYRIGLPESGILELLLNSDAAAYAGSGMEIQNEIKIEEIGWHHRAHSAEITIPPLGALVFRIKHT